MENKKEERIVRQTEPYSDEEILQNLHPFVREWFTNKFDSFTPPQRYSIRNIQKGLNSLISSPTGSGKCVTPDTAMIVEYNGNAHLLTGQDLIDTTDKTPVLANVEETGRLHYVHGLKSFSFNGHSIQKEDAMVYHEEYDGDVIQFRTRHGREVKVSPEHPLLIEREDSACWVPAKDIQEGDRLGVPRQIDLPEKEIELPWQDAIQKIKDRAKYVIDYPAYCALKEKTENFTMFETTDKIDHYRMQLLTGKTMEALACKIGTGQLKRTQFSENQLIIHCHDDTIARFTFPTHVDKRVARWTAHITAQGTISEKDSRILISQKDPRDTRQFLQDTKELFDLELQLENENEYVIQSTYAALFISTLLGTSAGKDRTVHLPQWLLNCRSDCKKEFLRVFLSLEAEVSQKEVRLSHASRQNIEMINYLMLSFGIFCSLATEKNTRQMHSTLSVRGVRNLNKILSFHSRYPPYDEFTRHTTESSIGSASPRVMDSGNQKLLELPELKTKNLIWLDVIEKQTLAYNGKLVDLSVPGLENFIGGHGGIYLHNTLSAFLSIINELVSLADKGQLEDHIYCIYMSPLKALANDINKNLTEPLQEIHEIAKKYQRDLPIRVGVRTGDTTQYEKTKMRENPPHILITTPESLAIMLTTKKFSESLHKTRYVIIDEIHALAENKRGTHMTLSMERLSRHTDYTRIGLSATVAPLERVAKYLVGFEEEGLPRPCKIIDVNKVTQKDNTSGFAKKLDLQALSPVEDIIDSSHETIQHETYQMIHDLVQKHRSTLIFTNTRSGTERVVHKLRERYPQHYANILDLDEEKDEIVEAEGEQHENLAQEAEIPQEIPAEIEKKDYIGAHHGSLSKEHRLKIENMLRDGEMKCAVCFHGNTEILMADGTWKNIKRIKTGEEVQAINKNLKLENKQVTKTYRTESKERLVKIVTSRGQVVRCTPNHKFRTINDKGKLIWKPAKEFSQGDFLATIRKENNAVCVLEGTHLRAFANRMQNDSLSQLSKSDIFWDTVKKTELDTSATYVYNLEVEEHHNYIANGLLAKNCSTSLELGIDIGYIDLVILLGSPKSVARALQRIGRSGHKLHAHAKGRIIVMDRDDLVECSVLLKIAMEGKIDRIAIPRNCLDVLAQQLYGMAIENRTGIEDAWRAVRKAYPYHSLQRKDFEKTLSYLAGEYADLEKRNIYAKIWLDRKEGMFASRGKMARLIYMTNVGTIPDETAIKVKIQDSVIGTVTEDFSERLKPGDVFVLGGEPYEFRFSRGTTIQVRTSGGKLPTVPSWISEMLPLNFDLAEEIQTFRKYMWQLLEKNRSEGDIKDWIRDYLPVSERAVKAIYNYFREQHTFSIVPHRNLLLLEHFKDGNKKYVFVHSLYGRRTNDCLARAMAYVNARLTGRDVEIGITDNGFYLKSTQPIQAIRALRLMKPEELYRLLEVALDRSEVLKRRFRHCAARALMILRNYKGREKSVGKQQISSQIIISTVRKMDEEFPILKEAKREILEDLMDIEHARQIVKEISDEKISLKEISHTIPSPFAFDMVMQSYTDLLKIEDRIEFVRRLHKMVLKEIDGSRAEKEDVLPKPEVTYERLWEKEHADERLKQEDRQAYLLELLERAWRKEDLPLDYKIAIQNMIRGDPHQGRKFREWLDGFLAGTIPRHWEDDLIKFLRD